MTCRELGNISSPLLICGGAYGNLQALQALAELQRELDIPHTHVIHTGDAVAYCADAEAATQFIASRGWPAIKGNVEEQIADGAQDCGCGFEEGTACDIASLKWFAHAQATLSAASKAWMSNLPARLGFSMNGVNAHVLHGANSQTNRFMWASLPQAEFAAEMNLANADLIIAGHTGIPFTRMIGSRCWHNCGALGMPANDGTQRVWASVISPQERGIELRHLALQPDASTAAKAVRLHDLPTGYADGLESGLWPSLDILPDEERAATGSALDLNNTGYVFNPSRAAAE